MLRADDRVLSALSALQNHPDWAVVKEWMIKSKAEDVKTMLAAKEDVQLRWLQGSVQTLTEIIDLSERAMAVLFKKK